ncbi:glycoside hydrolase family 3 protein [Zopfia rhizophila CBS 207.26]|uniref:beta-glucosidase n=1 Tax=Zopfia rhizophila CBS 207.26 TaxID=1314779 RepID=A0A6A6DNI9_9PEZI|nr:glycoside hydrolase family 3 protein [Zopfia rhizophila CBS 207.26]
MVTGGFDVGSCIGNIGPVGRLSLKGLCFSDGPTGINRADLVSVFPAGLTAAATWDVELLYQRGLALGAEYRGKGINVMLGPSVGPMGRHALGGRNWEGFGADPYLAENGVQTCSKHFIGNEQETQRTNTNVSGVDIQPFFDAVKVGTTLVMCFYNRYTTHSTVVSANSGLDVKIPGRIILTSSMPSPDPYFYKSLFKAVNNGSVSIAQLDNIVARVLVPYFLLSQDKDYPSIDLSTFRVLATYEIGLPQFLKLGYPVALIER